MTRADREFALASLHRAQLAEVVWLDRQGRPHAEVVIPMIAHDRPALALHYGRRDLARELADASDTWLTVTSPGVARGADPVAVRVELTVTPDPEGDRFVGEGLAEQEVAKHPPSRGRLDHLVARREHWWFVGRLLVTASAVTAVRHLEVAEAVVASVTEGALRVATTDLPRPETIGTGSRVPLTTAVADGPAVVLSHGAELSTLEIRWHRRWHGTVHRRELQVEEVDVEPPRDRRPTLRQRLRAERELRRACRAGLAASADDPRGW